MINIKIKYSNNEEYFTKFNGSIEDAKKYYYNNMVLAGLDWVEVTLI